VTLGFAEAVQGVTVPLRLATPGVCTVCRGSGAEPGTLAARLPDVQRQRLHHPQPGRIRILRPCRACRGDGRIIDNPMPRVRRCRSDDTGSHTHRAHPAASTTGSGFGSRARAPRPRGATPGDLFVLVHVSAHPVLGRNGRRPHRDGADQLSGGRTRRRCDRSRPSTARYACESRRHVVRPHVPRQGPRCAVPAPEQVTCLRPSPSTYRKPCPTRRKPQWRPLAAEMDGDPRAHLSAQMQP
jgi:hypothetical protein